MAHVSVQSQLMLHYSAEEVAPLSELFTVVRDEHSEALVFSKGNDGKFYMMKDNRSSGSNELVDLSKKLQMTGHVRTFAVSQDRDLTIHVVVAEAGTSPNETKIHILKPFKPSDMAWLAEDDLSKRILHGPVCQYNIERILLGNSDDAQGRPLVAAVYTDGVDVTKHAQILLIQFADDDSHWTFRKDFKLLEHADRVYDLCPASIPGARGIFILYELQAEKRLSFVGIPGSYGFSLGTLLETPPGAVRLASLTNAGGKYTDLIVAGKGLYRFPALSCAQSGSKAVLVSLRGSQDYANVVEMQVASAKGAQFPYLSIWCRTQEQSGSTIRYQLFELQYDLLKDMSPVVPLVPLPSNSPQKFAPMLDPVTLSQKLLVTDASDARKIKVLEQAGDTKIWQPAKDLTVHAQSNHRSIPAYMSVISLTDEHTAAPLPFQRVKISSPSSITVSVNGRPTTIGPGAHDVIADFGGNISVISHAEDLVPHTYTLTSPESKDILKGQAVHVDPAAEAVKRLQQLGKIGSDLLSQATTGGQDEKAWAMQSIQELSECTKSLATQAPSNAHASSTTSDSWEFWGWICQLASGVKSWAVERLGDLWRLVVDAAGRVFHFVLDCIGEVFSALRFILEDRLGIPVGRIIQYFGFLFDWDDILHTQSVLATQVEYFLTFPAELLQQRVEPEINEYVDNVKSRFGAPQASSEALNTAATTKPREDQQQAQAFNKPEVYWTTNLLHHGRLFSAAGGEDVALLNKDTENTVGSAVEAEEGSLTPAAAKLRASLSSLLESLSSLSLAHIRDLLVNTVATQSLELIRKVLTAMVRAGATVLDNVRKVLTSPLEIPIISSLCRKLLGKPAVSLLDAMCLILAIPATVIYKLVSGKSPKILSKLPVRRILEGSPPTDPAGWVNKLEDWLVEYKPLLNAANRFVDAFVIGSKAFELLPDQQDLALDEDVEVTKVTKATVAFLIVAWLPAAPLERPVYGLQHIRRFSWIISCVPIFAQLSTSRKKQGLLRLVIASLQAICHVIYIPADWDQIAGHGAGWATAYVSHVVLTDLTKITSPILTVAATTEALSVELWAGWSLMAAMGWTVGNFRYAIDPSMDNVSLYGT
ncbi:hypothetical protein VTK73DRAFT_5000 [Phialemonium thermophilum]|uniref:Uncharacterized protein n=1 Tax=Phialemonium thermophilum TaxID=223376 RepID=A0ABR3WQJ7_9PEZI